MPPVIPQARSTPETSRPADTQLSQESLSTRGEPSMLRRYAGIAAMSVALTNGEPANAQSPITPTPPPGYPTHQVVQLADGTRINVPVVSAIPQGYQIDPRNGLPLYVPPTQTTQQAAPQGQVAGAQTQTYAPPQTQTYGSAPANVAVAGAVPVVGGAQGAVPQGELRLVSPGYVQNGTTFTQAVGQSPVAAAPQSATPPALTAPGMSATVPSVAQAQLEYSAARMRSNPNSNPEVDQARLTLEAARLAEQQQDRASREADRQAIMYQRELMRYNADAQRYHYRRAQDIGWALDLVLPSSVPGPWVKPVPPRQPR